MKLQDVSRYMIYLQNFFFVSIVISIPHRKPKKHHKMQNKSFQMTFVILSFHYVSIHGVDNTVPGRFHICPRYLCIIIFGGGKTKNAPAYFPAATLRRRRRPRRDAKGDAWRTVAVGSSTRGEATRARFSHARARSSRTVTACIRENAWRTNERIHNQTMQIERVKRRRERRH